MVAAAPNWIGTAVANRHPIRAQPAKYLDRNMSARIRCAGALRSGRRAWAARMQMMAIGAAVFVSAAT